MSSENYFVELSKVNVTAHVEKKGQFSYLSWPFAVQELGKVDPQATWKVERHNGFPYIQTPIGYFVEVSVTCRGVTKSQIHPVLDQRNQPIKEPNAFHINTSIQRALVKAIALHGLGLYIYAGEDLPGEQDSPAASSTTYKGLPAGKGVIKPTDGAWDRVEEARKAVVTDTLTLVLDALKEDRDVDAYGYCESLTDPDEKVALWSELDSKQRRRLKTVAEAAKEKVPA